MFKKNLFFLFVVLNCFLHSSAQDSTLLSAQTTKNAFRLGLSVAIQGTGDELSMFYQNEYQRKLNKYFELGVGGGFFNYFDSVSLYLNEPVTKYNSTSIRSFELMLNLLVVDSRKHFLKLGGGYALRKVQMIRYRGIQEVYNEQGAYWDTEYIVDKVDGFDGGLSVNIEYGYKFSRHIASSFAIRYQSDGKYVSLAMIGFGFYYLF